MNKAKGVIGFFVLFTVLFSTFIFAANLQGIPWGNILKENENIIDIKKYGAAGDGVTDDSDVIQSAFIEATNSSKTVYFPAGNYLLKKTISLDYSYGKNLLVKGEDKDSVKILGAESLKGTIIETLMRSGLYFNNITFEHKGKGSCIDALYIDAYNCSFIAAESNPEDLVIFAGSNCRIEKCTFAGKNSKAYALRATRRADVGNVPGSGIAINSFIIDNFISGETKGVIVKTDNIGSRLEGLKINGNVFENTGIEQVTIQTVLHVDISYNTMKGSKGSAVVLEPAGLSCHGIYICNNTISATKACVYEAPSYKGSASFNICNNRMENSAFGVYLNSPVNYVVIDNNEISEISKIGIGLSEIPNSFVTNNKVSVKEAANSIKIAARDAFTVIAENEVNEEMKNSISGGKTVIYK